MGVIKCLYIWPWDWVKAGWGRELSSKDMQGPGCGAVTAQGIIEFKIMHVAINNSSRSFHACVLTGHGLSLCDQMHDSYS